ncbi:MAG: HNH endonuclease [Pirellulaceae bacterium]
MAQAATLLPHEVDHIIAQKHDGETAFENLCLACFACNAFKGPNIAGVDPLTKEICRLFHPRRDVWNEHFAWEGPILAARTAVGRTTLAVLRINQPERVEFRRLLMLSGDWTPAHS